MWRWGKGRFILNFSRKISTEENTLEIKEFEEVDGKVTFRSEISNDVCSH
jgi:hypothetical protein